MIKTRSLTSCLTPPPIIVHLCHYYYPHHPYNLPRLFRVRVRSEETVKTKEEQRDAARDVIIAKQQALQKAQAAAQ